jgi:hypothetical protein
MTSENQTSIFSILFLNLGALAIALFGGAAIVLIACYGGAFVGVLILYQMFTGRRPAKLTEILAASLLTGYCGGCAITVSFCGLDQHGVPIATGAIVPPAWVSYTIVIVLFACALLLIEGWFEPKLFEPSESIAVGWAEEWLIWLGIGLVLIEIYLGGFGYMGESVEQGTNRISVLADVAGSFLGVAVLLSAIGWMQSSGFRRFRFGLFTLAGLVVLVPAGRRALIYTLLVTVFAATRLSGVRVSLSRQAKWLWGIALLIIAFAGTVIFLGLRIATETLSAGSHPLTQIVQVAGDVFDDPSALLRATQGNLESRPFLLTQYLSLLTKGGDMPDPMYGADLKYNIELIIPDALFRLSGKNKDTLRAISTEEGLANEHFHLPVFDDANSILTGSVIDFGLIGIAIYPIGVCLLWRLVAVPIERLLGRKARLLFLLIALGVFLQAEIEISGYIRGLRSALIVLGTWLVLSAISRGLDIRGNSPILQEGSPDKVSLALN